MMQFIKKYSLILTIAFSTSLIFLFYSFVFKNPERLFFADTGGDGAKEYFSSIYHIKYDTSYFFCTSMNYPYGEELKFFGIQSLPVNAIKFIHEHTGLLNEFSVVAYINLSIILSLLVSAVFIHLILKKLELPWWMIVLFATPIAFLTPQLDRFSGHYPLAINCFIPISMYLLMVFHERRTIRLSLLIGVFHLYVYEVHGYFFFMTATLPAIYFIYMFFKDRLRTIENGLHFFIQIILPFVVIVLLDIVSSGIKDRTAYPWGHMEYLAKPESIFLPISRPYFDDLARALFKSTDYMSIEGRAFVGYAALLVILSVLFRLVICRDTKPFTSPTENTPFNVVLLASVLLLLFSMGFPFILELQNLVQYSGPVKQLRALGRFSWPFYYALNIFTVYYIYYYFKTKTTAVITACLVVILAAEVIYTNGRQKEELNNRWSDLTSSEYSNNIQALSRVVDAKHYAAILPLPFFNVGSENINIDVRCEGISKAYAMSLRTGLPLISTMSSRLSFRQAYEMQKIYFEPYRKNNIWEQIKNKSNKPVLLMVEDCSLLSAGEQALITCARKIAREGTTTLYILDTDCGDKIAGRLYEEKIIGVDTLALAPLHAEQLSNGFYYNDFKAPGRFGYLGAGVFSAKISKRFVIDTITVPKTCEGKYILSFWYSDIYFDVLPRTDLLVDGVSEAEAEHEIVKCELSKRVKIIDGHWALYEDTIYIPQGIQKIILYGINKEISKGIIQIDDILLRPAAQQVLFSDPQGVIINNRRYLKNIQNH
ncbi:MAG: hypothetical protein ACTHJT_09420 [Cytophaga sp.]|uniref:hypothetical protein n=1 Tax=Cytophaga sp. TaxID=29535 RepID=UPI003F7FD0FF